MKINHVIACAIVMTVFAQVGHAQAQQTRNNGASSVLSYRGVLDTDNGVIDGTVDLTVTIYSDPIGSFNIWEDTYHVRVDKGVFSVKLGSEKHPLPNVDAAKEQLWLRFTVNGKRINGLTPLNKSDYTISTDDRKAENMARSSEAGFDLSQVPGLGVNMVYNDKR
jgi:hypothetical protein